MKTFAQFLEAAGDPIKPSQVISLKDPEVQRNLKSAESKPTQSPKPTDPDRVRQFIQRMRINTMLSPL
jgi:hypothetical protein